jgi:hypothetical protein
MYLRCFTSDRPRRWFQWLPWVEYCYNTSYHSSLKTTPFEVGLLQLYCLIVPA